MAQVPAGTHSFGSTSISLLRRVWQNDPEAWARFARIYTPLVYYWLRSRANLQAADAADVLQDVFHNVTRGISRFRKDSPSDSFRGWLFAVTRNCLADFMRKQQQHPQSEDISELQPSLLDRFSDEDAHEAEDVIILRQALNAIRDDLRSTTWAAFWEVTMDGRHTDEVAGKLGLSAHAIHQACYRVRRRLMEEMEGLIE